MSPERAWELAPRLIPRGLLSDDDFVKMRYRVALAIADYDEPIPESVHSSEGGDTTP